MRLPSPLVVGTIVVFLVSGPARAAKPHGAGSSVPSASAAADTAPPAAKAPGSPAAPDTAPATPAAKPASGSPARTPGGAPVPASSGAAATAPASGRDVPMQAAPESDAAATTPVEPPAQASSTPAAPVVQSASIRRRTSAGAPPPKSPVVGDDVEEEPKPARDTVGGHVAIGLNAGFVLPFGSVASDVPQSRTLGVGWSFGADLAYGISRTVMLGAYVDVGLPEAQGPASGDSVSTIAAGPLIRYHLVQGVPFDPWVAGGVGFRRTSAGGTTLTGVDWARLSLGGDFYPASNLGFGPILELSLGTFFAESPGTLPTKALNAHFVAGVRVVFDAPGK